MDKYSRQIGAFGIETMAKVRTHLIAVDLSVSTYLTFLFVPIVGETSSFIGRNARGRDRMR